MPKKLAAPVNPARAGMILWAVQVPSVHGCKPRASGDDPLDLDVFYGSEA